MNAIVPRARPQLTRDKAAALLMTHGINDGFALIGCRGYFRDSMGEPGRNDCGLYDDAVALITPAAFETFNANTDPSRGAQGMAALQLGVWWYQLGTHGLNKVAAKRYQALVQAAAVDVHRQGTGGYAAGRDVAQYGRALGDGIWRGWFGINIHRGGFNTTSSLGCQTIHPEQWVRFISLVRDQLKAHGRTSLPYVLVEQQG